MALYTIRSGVTNHPEKSVLQFTSDLVRQGGVMSGFTVSEKSGVGMSVDVAPGTLYACTASEAYPVNANTISNVSVPLNASANGRIDTLVCYLDLEITPTADGQGAGIAAFAVIPGTPGTEPQAPSDSDITSIIGTGNPYEKIANITVGSQVSAIMNENITFIARRPYIKTSHNVTDLGEVSGVVTLDASTSDTFIATMTGNVTLNLPTNMRDGDFVNLQLIQDSSGEHGLVSSNFTIMSSYIDPTLDANTRTNYIIHRIASTYYLYVAGRQ